MKDVEIYYFYLFSLESVRVFRTAAHHMDRSFVCVLLHFNSLFSLFYNVQLVKHYEVRPDPAGTTVTPITRTLLCPAKPINLQFLDRESKPARRAAAGISQWAGLVCTLCCRSCHQALVYGAFLECKPNGMHLNHSINRWCVSLRLALSVLLLV